jgi:predicted nucleotidyltransferase
VAAADRVFEADEILRMLSAHGVDFVVIGGIAVQAHGYIRATKDLDIVARPTVVNLARLSEALTALEAEPYDLDQTPLVPVMTKAGPLDVVHIDHLAGAPASYDALRERALVIELRELEVRVAGLSDLIRMKRAAGRDHDLADIEALTRTPEPT